MRRFWNFLLGLGTGVCLFFLIFQGFAAPSLPVWADVLLRFLAALCLQWLLLRTGKTVWIRTLPLGSAALLAVWGFFLFLTSPSWQSATLWHFLADYGTPLAGCVFAGILCGKIGK